MSHVRKGCDLCQYYETINNLTSLNPADYFTVHQPSLISSRASSSVLLKPFNGLTMVITPLSTRRLTAELALVNIKKIYVTKYIKA